MDKYYETTNIVLVSVFLIVLGIILFLGKSVMYQYLTLIFSVILFLKSLVDLFRLIFRKQDKDKYYFSIIFHFLFSVFLVIFRNVAFGLLPFLFFVYLILIGISQVIMCVLEIINRDFIRFRHIVIMVVCFWIGGIIFDSSSFPFGNMDTFLKCLSIYCFLFGSFMLFESLFRLLSKRSVNRLKRHIRITLPKFVEALIPYSIMLEINRNLALEKSQVYSFSKGNVDADLNILIHTSNRGVNRMGHMDLCFDGQVFSFGNYDEGSRSFHDFFGRGVMFMTCRKGDYINFCIDNSKKTVFDFGIVLSKRQKEAVIKKIDSIMKCSVKWDYRSDKKMQSGGVSYVSKLYSRTKANFYQFTKGKYHTYFVLGMNCCSFVDDIVGSSGMDIVSINGIITPGTYYDYLNREFCLKKSNVISKEIYNCDRRFLEK